MEMPGLLMLFTSGPKFCLLRSFDQFVIFRLVIDTGQYIPWSRRQSDKDEFFVLDNKMSSEIFRHFHSLELINQLLFIQGVPKKTNL